MVLINGTPHDINILPTENGGETRTLERCASGGVRLVADVTANGIPPWTSTDGILCIAPMRYLHEPVDIPTDDPQQNCKSNTLVVAEHLMAMSEEQRLAIWKGGIAVPNTGPTELGSKRDADGKIVGTRSLIVFC